MRGKGPLLSSASVLVPFPLSRLSFPGPFGLKFFSRAFEPRGEERPGGGAAQGILVRLRRPASPACGTLAEAPQTELCSAQEEAPRPI